MMDDVSKGAELLALLTPVQVEGTTDDLTGQVIGQIDGAFKDALAAISDPRQGLCLMVCTLSMVASMVGGAAASALDLPASDEGLMQGKLAALDCVRAIVEGQRVRH